MYSLNIIKRLKLKRRRLGSGAVSMLAVSVAFAQGQAADTLALEEVIVTATRRSVNLQEVPLAISALEGKDLQQRGVQDFSDYVRSVPGVSYIDRGPAENKIIIRGVTDGPFSPGEPTTGIYIDETSVTQANRAADLNFFDIERVEVLRGPQGTLYGASSMGGTLRVILNKPDVQEFAASFDGSVSSTEDGDVNHNVNAMLNVPLARDKLALRLVGYEREDGGFIDNVAPGGESDVNSSRIRGGRALLGFEPSENLTIRGGFTYQRTTADGRPQEDHDLDELQQFRIYPEDIDNEWTLGNIEINARTGWGTLTSSTSWFEMEQSNGTDFSRFFGLAVGLPFDANGRPLVAVGLDGTNEFSEFAQEIRLASDDDRPLQRVVGVYYSKRDNEANQSGPAPAPLAGLGLLLVDADINQELEQYAVFGELSYSFTDRLRALVGARAFKVELNSEQISRRSLNSPADTFSQGETSEDGTNLKFGLDFKLTPDNLLYLQAAQGFRPGGAKPALPPTCPSANATFDSDAVWNYEIGSKNSFLDQRMRLNAAAYLIEWTDIQVRRALACGASPVVNAGKARVKGVEAELEFQPAGGLIIAPAVTYTDTELTDPGPAPNPGNPGDPLPNVPEWQGSLAAQYTHTFTSGLAAFLRGDYQYVGSSMSDLSSNFVPNFVARQPSYEVGNVRLGIRGRIWEAALFVNNVSNTKAQLWTRELGSAGLGIESSVVNRPRTIGINVKANF